MQSIKVTAHYSVGIQQLNAFHGIHRFDLLPDPLIPGMDTRQKAEVQARDQIAQMGQLDPAIVLITGLELR